MCAAQYQTRRRIVLPSGAWRCRRPLRMPARAAADRALAGALTAHAEASLGEAMHESGRQLLALWFDWLNAASQTKLWLAQMGRCRPAARHRECTHLGDANGNHLWFLQPIPYHGMEALRSRFRAAEKWSSRRFFVV